MILKTLINPNLKRYLVDGNRAIIRTDQNENRCKLLLNRNRSQNRDFNFFYTLANQSCERIIVLRSRRSLKTSQLHPPDPIPLSGYAYPGLPHA